jgi:hypothetical protein
MSSLNPQKNAKALNAAAAAGSRSAVTVYFHFFMGSLAACAGLDI